MATATEQPSAAPQLRKLPSPHAGAEAMRGAGLPAPQLQGNIFGSLDESRLARAEALAAVNIAPHAKGHRRHRRHRRHHRHHRPSSRTPAAPPAAASPAPRPPPPTALAAPPHPLLAGGELPEHPSLASSELPEHPSLASSELLEHPSPSLAAGELLEHPSTSLATGELPEHPSLAASELLEHPSLAAGELLEHPSLAAGELLEHPSSSLAAGELLEHPSPSLAASGPQPPALPAPLPLPALGPLAVGPLAGLPPPAVPEVQPDPRELEAFAQRFRQRRVRLGVTQADAGAALAALQLPGVGSLSQSTICRFESLTLSHNNMAALRPALQAWLEAAEAAHRLRPAAPEPLAGAKRKRASIAAPEKRSLEACFALQPRPSSEKIAAIAEKLDLNKNVVRVWFCNQRQKQKRMKYSAGR